MTVDLVLKNAKIFTNGHIFEGGLAIDNKKIVKIGKFCNLPDACLKMDVRGNLVIPGLIDLHVHLRDQLFDYKEDMNTGTAAAAIGGVTSVLDMPNNKPVTMNVASLKSRIQIATKRALVNVGFYSALPTEFEEIDNIVDFGAMGFKVYFSNRIGGIDIDDDDSLLIAFRKIAQKNVPICVHAEDRSIIDNRKKILISSGKNDIEDFLIAHPVEAEVKSINRIIGLVRKCNVHTHFCHVSSRLGLIAILSAKEKGLPITCEVTPHNLFLTSETYKRVGFLGLTVPPLRQESDVSAIWNALLLNKIDAIASDHAPHELDEKMKQSVWDVSPGIPGLETMLALLLTEFNRGRLSLNTLVRITSENPARLLHINGRGSITEGNWADLVVVDLKQEGIIDSSSFMSKAKYSPFDGFKIKGKPLQTFVNGNLVMDENEIVSESICGKIINH